MEMPKPTDGHARLAALAGDWEGPEVLHPCHPFRPDRSEATGRYRSRMALDGFFLLVDYEEHRDGVRLYAGHGVYGYDAKDGSHTMDWFDVMGGFHPEVVRGRFEGGVLTFRTRTPFGHARYTYRLDGPDAFSLEIAMSQDGTTWAPFLEGRYRRVAG